MTSKIRNIFYICIIMNSTAKKIILLLIAALAVIYGCSNYRDIQLKEIKLQSIRLKSASGVEISLKVTINNPTSSEIKISNISGTLFRDGSKFADIKLIKPTPIPPQAESVIILPLKITFNDPLSLIVMGTNITTWDQNNFTADITVSAEDGILRKNFNKKGIKLNKYIKNIIKEKWGIS